MDESMTYRPAVIEPGKAGRGGGRRVIGSMEDVYLSYLPKQQFNSNHGPRIH